MSSPKKREYILLVLALAVFAAVVINVNLFSARFDLTSGGAYSISSASKAVVAQAKDPITATYYLSKKLTDQFPLTQGYADVLADYGAASNGRVKVRVVDPKESGQLNDMERLGIQGTPMSTFEENQNTQTIIYTGVVLQYQDRQEVLPFLNPQDPAELGTFEYELTNRISKLITQKQKTIAFLSVDPSRTLQRDFTVLSQTLSKEATFRQVQPGEAVGDADVLVVVGSKGFTKPLVKTVDDYVMKGGKVLFAVDGISVDLNSPQGLALPLADNELLKALEIWGVHVDPSMVFDGGYNNQVPFQTPQGVMYRRYPQWPQILPKDTSTTNPVTSRFAGLSVLWASPLDKVDRNGVKAESLAWTSDKSWVVKDNMSINPDAAMQSMAMGNLKTGKHDVAVALSGTFASAAEPAPGASAPQVSPPTRMIVVGSSQFLSDFAMKIVNSDQNAVFADTAVDWLAQDEGLLSIKTRAYRDKSLTLLQDPNVRSATAWSLTITNLVLVPLALIAWAVVRLLRRRAREQKR
jgi:gliding-associated putative ABC transporter substrate-binding component GldG